MQIRIKGYTFQLAAPYSAGHRLTPGEAEALNNLAWELAANPRAEIREGPRAVQLAQRACALIRQTAEAAARKLKKNPPKLLALRAPFESVTLLRPDEPGKPKLLGRATHPSSFIELMRMAPDFKPVS